MENIANAPEGGSGADKAPAPPPVNPTGKDLQPEQITGDNKIIQPPTPGGVTITQPDQRKLELAQRLNTLANEVVVADEWGVFNIPKSEAGVQSTPSIYKVLAEAYEALAAEKFEQVETELLNGRAALNHAQTTNRVWVLNNRYGILPILFTVIFALLTYWLVFQVGLGLDKDIIQHPAFAGMVGAVLKSLYWLQFQTSKGLLRPRWFTAFIVTPLIGAILGWLVSLIVAPVAQIVGGSAANTDWKTISLLAVFAGFKWQWALNWLEEASKSIQSRIKEKTPVKPKP